jgi:hypothetical protein
MIYIVIQFIPYSPLNDKGNGNLPIEVSGFRCRGSRAQRFRILRFKGSEVLGSMRKFTPATLNGER